MLVIEPNAALRAAITTVLSGQDFQVEECDSLEQLLVRADPAQTTVALMAWQAMDGLLAEEHRPDLVELSRRLRLIVMVPRRWLPLLEHTDLGVSVAGIIPKPIDADQLIGIIERAAQS